MKSLPARLAPLRSPGFQAACAGAAALLLFALLDGRNYVAVDGALRCLEVYHRRELFFHGNNHLLYPANVLLWHRFLALFGWTASTPAEFLRLTQLMNAAAAAGCIAVFHRLIHLATGSWRAAIAGAACFALCRAFLLHATHSAEPMAGLLWSLLALLVLALQYPRGARGGLTAPLAAGALLALALATYQSTFLLTPAAAILCVVPAAGRSGGLDYRRSAARLLAAAAGGSAVLILVYGAAYSLQGIEGLGAKVEHFFTLNSPEVFGRPSLRKVALVPLGFAANLFPALPEGFSGIRSLLRSPPAFLLAASSSFILTSLTALGAVAVWRARRRLESRERLAVLSGVTGLATTALGPAVWDPVYDKLWLQPIAAWVFLAALVLARVPSPRRRAAWATATVAATAILAAVNLGLAVLEHLRPTPYLAEAQQIAERTAGRDLVVQEWDGVSVLYGAFWGWSPQRHRFDFPTTAIERGSRIRADLDRAVLEAWRRGGRVWFIGLLDLPSDRWEVFLGRVVGVPYEVLAPYRAGARPAGTLPYRQSSIHLFVWEGPPPDAAGSGTRGVPDEDTVELQDPSGIVVHERRLRGKEAVATFRHEADQLRQQRSAFIESNRGELHLESHRLLERCRSTGQSLELITLDIQLDVRPLGVPQKRIHGRARNRDGPGCRPPFGVGGSRRREHRAHLGDGRDADLEPSRLARQSGMDALPAVISPRACLQLFEDARDRLDRHDTPRVAQLPQTGRILSRVGSAVEHGVDPSFPQQLNAPEVMVAQGRIGNDLITHPAYGRTEQLFHACLSLSCPPRLKKRAGSISSAPRLQPGPTSGRAAPEPSPAPPPARRAGRATFFDRPAEARGGG